MLFPLFLKLAGRDVLVVGGGPIGAAKARSLVEAGARVTLVAPHVEAELRELAAAGALELHARAFVDADVDGAWLVVAAATPEVNRAVAAAAEARRTFVLAVDDPASASAYGAGVVRRGGVTVAVSTDGRAPALAGLLREALEAVLPDELASWSAEAERLRGVWKGQRVPMAARRPMLLDALNGLYAAREAAAPANDGAVTPAAAEPASSSASPSSLPTWPAARVALVGAGPGDPELITVRGARRLAEAELVLYDALGSERLRDLAPRARWFYVGKRACRQSIGQDVLNRLLVKNARRGLNVVRLKGGDPFVFGRGGEEALALAEAGFACEIVPGVSSAVAAPALAGIPVTHRGMASSFAVLTGHHEETYAPLLAGFAPGSLTLVVMMGLRQRARVAELLVARGWAATTPAAIVVGAATPEAWRWTGTLDGLGAAEIPPESREAPGLLVIGEVVSLAGALRLEAGASASVTRSLP